MQNKTMNFKYRMHLCFSFTEPAAAIQNSRSHHRRGDVTSQPPSYSLGETAGNICPMLHIRREFCKWHLVMATQHFLHHEHWHRNTQKRPVWPQSRCNIRASTQWQPREFVPGSSRVGVTPVVPTVGHYCKDSVWHPKHPVTERQPLSSGPPL